MDAYPSYLALSEADWGLRIKALRELFSPCALCPRVCLAARADDEPGECRAARDAIIGSYNLHFGEEPPITGRRGSGTVFFSGCNLHCLYCQNYPISQMAHGTTISVADLAGVYIELERRGAHNLNLVSPSHVNLQWFEALFIARGRGFSLPVVYNSGGYDRVEILKLFVGVVDIYMPDAKYRDPALAGKLSDVPDYPEVNAGALREMYRQVGALVTDDEGVARRGLLVRHLMLPGKLKNTLDVIEDVAEIGTDIALNLMTQYFPAYKAMSTPGMDRRVSKRDYRAAEKRCEELELVNGFFQRI